MRLDTRSRSPWTGWSSASWGSTRYNQSTSAWRASANWPENSRASSSLCCLKGEKMSYFHCHHLIIWPFTCVINSLTIQSPSPSFSLFTSPRSCHRRCPTCHGLLPPGGRASVCLLAAEPCPSWPSQTSLSCRKPAALIPTLSETPGYEEKKGRRMKEICKKGT